MKNKLFLTLVFLCFSPLAVQAESFPSFPMAFYGTTTLNNQALPQGSMVQAYSGDDLIGEIVLSEAGIYGYNFAMKAQLLVSEYTSSLEFRYKTLAMNTASAGLNPLKYNGAFLAGDTVQLDLNFKTESSNSSSGGGGGGGSTSTGGGSSSSSGQNSGQNFSDSNIPNISPITIHIPDLKDTQKGEDEEIRVLGIEYADYSHLKNYYGLSGNLVNEASAWEAQLIINSQAWVELTNENKALFARIKQLRALPNDQAGYNLATYIQNGTPATLWLGAGERAGALASYISAFSKFPQTQSEWQDVVKIANGRWPAEKNQASENEAKRSFKKIYLHEADISNANENAAVTIMAYGLRPVNRNLKSEKIAIQTFKHIFKNNPQTPRDWDMVRAIAYSGAKR